MAHMLSNDSTRFRKACIFTTLTLRENTCTIASGDYSTPVSQRKRLVDAFIDLEIKLDRQSKEREKLACQVARLSGKDSRAILTDEIKKFIVYARGQGSNNADRYYSSITNITHKALVILEPKATQVRELLTTIQLSRLATIELTAAEVLTEQMSAETPYKEIYQAVKLAVSGFIVDRANVLGG
jgi:hypothetical protein